MSIYKTREGARLLENENRSGHWNRWGPYLAERAWGTVREDYSPNGDAWSYFSHDQARSRAYRWNEDGLAGICDRHQYLCFALALWNGRDPFLKERMFGLTGPEGNHGEDVKEYYFYLDNTPTHSYMKYLYKYPQAEFPYERLREENRKRGKKDGEFELVDTGIFAENRYFDVMVEYAKVTAEDILCRITISNRGPEAAPIDVLPTLWFRNNWRWDGNTHPPAISIPVERATPPGTLLASHNMLGDYLLCSQEGGELLFTENETNCPLVFNSPSATSFVKDAFHEYVVKGRREAVNPSGRGTKAAVRYHADVLPGQSVTFELRLASKELVNLADPFTGLASQFDQRKAEADEFYRVVLGSGLNPEESAIARQAFAGLLWSKQYYHFVVKDWLRGDPGNPPPPPERHEGRNHDWIQLFSRDVLSVPDKWEFPWFATWDLGFHCTALTHVDPQFAKEQIILMLREWYMHPNGQIPAYEWDFGDVNPPVLALSARAVFEMEQRITGKADYQFIARVFQKMLLNFTWWVNRKDPLGKNIFQGGFLGMDNIGAFDRGKLPPGYMLGQADGTSWMAAFAKTMFSLALLLADQDPTYEDLASKFWEHFIYIANSMNNLHDPKRSLWDEEDGFFYDQLIAPDGSRFPIRARTMVGFVPMFGATTVHVGAFDRFKGFQRRRQWFAEHKPELLESVSPMMTPGPNHTVILGLVRPDQLRRMLTRMLDENEFLSPYGIRAVSRYHLEHPLIFNIDGQEHRLDYEPGESQTNLFGGNSNWRGPVWMPVNFLIIFSLRQYHLYYGDSLKVECPTGSGNFMNLHQVANEIARRISNIFLRDKNGRRAVFGDCDYFNQDPNWRDLIPFYEYFHGDTGRGCGASHQTGWTGLIAQVLMSRGARPEITPLCHPPQKS